jgi:hypothetical protein
VQVNPAPEVPVVSLMHERARVASLTRSRSDDDPELLDARRNLAAERLAAYIEKTVSAAPPFSEDQRARLTSLLRPVPSAAVQRAV